MADEPSILEGPGFDHEPWGFWTGADEDARRAQLALQQRLASTRGYLFGTDCFISPLAAVAATELSLGDASYVAAGAYVTGQVRIGGHCSINAYDVVRGRVTLGDGVRIGAHTSILGFTHRMDDVERPIYTQPLASRGITVADDVWIGSHAVMVDGVRVGSHAVIGAGSVVTKDVPEWAIVAGNPATFRRDRRGAASASAAGSLETRLACFADRARGRAAPILERAWGPREFARGGYVNSPGESPTVRAHCDAVEIADLLLGGAPAQLSPAEHVGRLRGWQDPSTGLVPEVGADGVGLPGTRDPQEGAASYHVLCVGYALDELGSSFEHPVRAVSGLGAAELVRRLDRLPWAHDAWGSGHVVDMFGTALRWNRDFDGAATSPMIEAIFGWLLTRASPATGLWGSSAGPGGPLQAVNGFYRASRGTFAQFGLPLPYPERVIDVVLAHAADPRYFAPEAQNACNVLDVAHPLWLASRECGAYRRPEIRAIAGHLLSDSLERWTDDGFAFSADPGDVPGLQGTEMWLAITWYLADLLDAADSLGYRPRGVHRPEPVGFRAQSARG